MWTKSYCKFFSGVSKDAVWRLWSDVNGWPTWDAELEACQLEGKFEVGQEFLLTPKGGSPVKIVLTEVTAGRSFTDSASFFGAKMFDCHLVEEQGDGVVLTVTVSVTGPLRWIWVKLVAQNVFDTVPKQLEALIELARKRG